MSATGGRGNKWRRASERAMMQGLLALAGSLVGLVLVAGQSDEGELEATAPTPEGMFNAALGMPVVSCRCCCPLLPAAFACFVGR